MKVFICKFSNEKDIKDKISKLVFRKKKQGYTNIRVFSIDAQIQKELELAGIPTQILHDFDYYSDEPSWEQAFHFSDELHSSSENNDMLKYSGINFLTIGYNYDEYILAVKFSKLCRRMEEQNCQVLVFILTGSFNSYLRDINSKNIKTIRYDHPIEQFPIIRQFYKICVIMYYFISRPWRRRSLLTFLAGYYFKKFLSKNHPAFSENSNQRLPRVLFIVSDALYARPALAICNECLRNGLIPTIATRNTALIPLLQRNQIEYSVKPEFIPPLVLNAAGTFLLFIRLRRYVNSFCDKSGRLDTKPKEFSTLRLLKNNLLAGLPRLCYEAISHITFLERLIIKTSPDLICLMDRMGFLQQMAWALAKDKYDIPTLACSAGMESEPPSLLRHLHADKIAVMGDKMRNAYISSGVEPERVIATGLAHFDLLFNRNKEQDNQVLLGCGIDLSKKTIVFGTDYGTEEVLGGVINAVLKMEDFQLVVKVHPRQAIGTFQTVAERYHNSRIHVVQAIDLYALISNSELLITTYSTTALEAMIIDKPVIVINLSGKPYPVPYIEEGAAIGVFRHEDIEQAILKALYDEKTRSRLKAKRDKFVRNWACEPDGKASQRIVTLMKDMIGRKRDTSSITFSQFREERLMNDEMVS